MSTRTRTDPDSMLRMLSEHVQFGLAYVALFERLCAAIEHNEPFRRCATDFVYFATRALRDAALGHVFRLFDTAGSGVSVSAYIRLVSPTSARQSTDLGSVSSRDPTVRKLLRLRHSAVAHTSRRLPAPGADAYLATFPVTTTELRQLLRRAHTLLTAYSGQSLRRLLLAHHKRAINEIDRLGDFLSDVVLGSAGLEHVVLEEDGAPRGQGRRLTRKWT